MKHFRIISAIVFFATLLFVLNISANAEGESIGIYTADDLLKISEKSDASYILMNDIDMKGIDWKPVDFSGIFDGNNHAILNLSVTGTSNEIRTTYDGNYKIYDTCFAGLFGVLENANVKNLSVLGINVEVQKEDYNMQL